MTEDLLITVSSEYVECTKDSPSKHPLYAAEYVLRAKEETPRFLHRDAILSGYRLYFSFLLCFKSLFRLHNETGNVWTHFFGFLYFTYSFSSTLLFEPDVLLSNMYLFFYFLSHLNFLYVFVNSLSFMQLSF